MLNRIQTLVEGVDIAECSPYDNPTHIGGGRYFKLINKDARVTDTGKDGIASA